jgi:hypothetical protein
VRGDAVAATARRDRMHARGNVDHRPVHEFGARLFDGDQQVVAPHGGWIGRRIGVDAQQHERLRVGRNVRPRQVRIAIAAESVRRRPSRTRRGCARGVRNCRSSGACMRVPLRPGPAMVPWTLRRRRPVVRRPSVRRSHRRASSRGSRSGRRAGDFQVRVRRQRSARNPSTGITGSSSDIRMLAGTAARQAIAGDRIAVEIIVERTELRVAFDHPLRQRTHAQASTLSSKSCCCGNSLRLRASESRHLRSKYHMYSGSRVPSRPSCAPDRAPGTRPRRARAECPRPARAAPRAARSCRRANSRPPPSAASRSGARLPRPRARLRRCGWNGTGLR